MLRRERKEKEASHHLQMATMIMVMSQQGSWNDTKSHLGDMERRYTDELWHRSYDFVYRIVELYKRRAKLQTRLDDYDVLDDVAGF